jgi:two-component system chemotaxis response regulator CheB
VVVFSSVAQAGSKNAMLALRLGAVSVLPKPEKVIANKQFHHELIQSIKEAYAAKDKLARMSAKTPFTVISADRKRVNQTPTRKIIAIGASTGGTAALQYLLPKLHHDIPGLVIVQHMPGDFTRWFAEGLNRTTIIKVQEAEAGAVVCRGNAYIANGFFHLKVKNRANQFVLSLQDGKEVNRHKPSVDVLFNSLAETAGERGIGILLTGMGDDGAKGLLNMKKVGAVTIAQDQNSSIVYGMPREAVKLGAAKYILSLDEIVSFINNS